MACINPNTPEFKAALERTGNPLIAEMELDVPSVKPGVAKLFQESSELAAIGTSFSIKQPITELQSTVSNQLINEENEELPIKGGQSYVFLNKKDAERFSLLIEKHKEFPKTFRVSSSVTKYEKDAKNPLKYNPYKDYRNFDYVKSNNNKKSNLYNIVDAETGEVIASKIRVLNVSKDVKSEIAAKYGLEFEATKIFNANRSIAFALYREKPSKAKYIAQAKKYLYDAIKFLNPEESSLKINLDQIENLLESFPEEMWDYINTTYSPEDSTNVNASIGLQNNIKFKLPKLGLLTEIEKITGKKLQGVSFKNYDRSGSIKKVLRVEWGESVTIDYAKMTTKQLRKAISYYLNSTGYFKPTSEEENVRKYAEHKGINYNELKELVFGDIDKAIENIAYNRTGNSDEMEVSKWRQSIREYDWQIAELFSKPYEDFLKTAKERITEKFKDKTLSNGISHLDYFFSGNFNWLNINFNNISGQYYGADMETESEVGVEKEMKGVINPFEMRTYTKPKAGKDYLKEQEVFNRLAAILHEPFHALHALSYNTKEEIELREAFYNLYNTDFGKEMMNQVFGSGYNQGQPLSEDVLYKEFTAFSTQLLLYPKQWIQKTDLRSNDIYEFIEKVQNLQDKTYQEVVTIKQKIGTTEKVVTNEEIVKLTFLEKLYNFITSALNKIIPLSKSFLKTIPKTNIVSSTVVEDVFGEVEETITKTLKLPENVKKSKEQFLQAMDEFKSAINTLMQIDTKLFSSENVNKFFTSERNYQQSGRESKLEEVKPGVTELFDSSPELANAVYEALGFKNYNGITVELGRSKIVERGKVQNIIVKYNGKYIIGENKESGLGEMNVMIQSKDAFVGMIRIPTEFQGKGLSKYIYQATADLIDTPIINSKERGESQTESGGYVWKNKTSFQPNQITPQQKQQAQQLYSQYLDTIFPDSKVKDIVYHGTDSKFDVFNDDFLSKKDPGYKGKGFYFWHGKKALEGARHVAFAYLNREITSKDIISALINLKNPKEIISGDYSNTGKILEGFDGAIEIPYSSEKIKPRKKDTSEVMVKSASQIHILGGKQDVEGFKKFVSQEGSSTMFQLKGETESSKASNETVTLVKDLLKRIGVDIKQLENIVVDGIKQDANGAALIMQKLVLITEGKENVALTEEAMHFVVEILEQTNPKLFNKLLKEINSYKLLNSVINDYGKDKNYQTPDGKPDIRKLKKEAIAKVLTETVIKKNEGSVEKPELLAKVQTWWQQIIDALKGLFSTSGFDQAAMSVLKGEAIGTVEDIRLKDEVYLQSALTPQQKIVNRLREISSKIEKPSGEGGKYKINGKPIKLRVTEISKNWLEKRFEDNQLTKDEYDIAVDNLLAEKGTMLHAENDWMLKNHFLDADGKFIKDEAFRPSDDGYVSQLSPLDKTFYNKLKKNMEDRLNTFPPNTVFLAETTIYDPKRDLAGTVDFIAVETSGKTHILDWKFKRITNVELQDDIPWYNVISWRTQMKNYKSILSNAYGATFDGTEQTRMIPFRAVYTKANKQKGILPQLIDIEVGDVNAKQEERLYLVPVGLEEERTGEKRVDELITKLNQIYETLSDIKVSTDKKKEKAEQLNELYKAIRQLQMRKNLKPLIYQAGVLNKTINNLVTEYYNEWAGKDISQFSQEQRNEFAWRIQNYEKSLSVYATLYKNLKPLFQGELSEADKIIKEELKEVTEEANDLQLSLEEVRESFAENVIAKSSNVLDYLKPEKIIKGFSNWFGSTSTLQNKSTQILYKMANRAFTLAAQETQTQGEILKGIKQRYDAWARSKGLTQRNYFDIIKKKAGYNKEAIEEKRKEALEDLKLRKDLLSAKEYANETQRINEKYDNELKGKNELIDEYNPKFYSLLRKNTKDRNFEWVKENVDVDAFKEYITKKKEEELERANTKTRYGSEYSIKKQIADDLIKIELKYDITSKEGLGWLLYDELRKFPKEEWKSAEWKELYKKDSSGKYVNAPAVEFYEYIKGRNEYFESINYITAKQERTFLPYVRKGLVEKITMGGDVTLFDSTLRAITVSEGDVGYGEIDPIDKSPVYAIPKYFTRDTGEETSNDLFKTMTLINESALRYQYLSEMEGQLHLIVKTEANKQAIKTSYFGKTKINADGEPELTNDNTENTQLLRDMMEGIVYGHKFVENQTFDQLLIGLGGMGKKVNDKLGIKLFPEEYDNNKISLNKSINWLNNAFQLKALGLNPLSAIATLLGGSFQSTINAGKYFTKSEFLKNEFLIASRMNGVDAKKYVGALQYFLPLTENMNKIIAADLSLSKFSEEALQDKLMIMMRKADQYVQSVNFFSFLDNAIVEDGKLLNVREYLRTTPEYANIYSVSGEERKRLNDKFEEDVKKLVAEKGVMNVAKIENNNFVIPGIDRNSDTVIELRRKVQGITKDALGNLSEDDIRRINLNIYGKSFMVFKNWIPRLVDVRMGNLKYNSATEAYEWGRTRMMMRWLTEEKLKAFGALKSAILGNDEVWVEQMRRLYEKKKADYEKDTGKKLMMTETEFIELAAQNIKNQAVDVLFYLALTGLVLAAKGLKDDDDYIKKKLPKNPWAENRINYMIKVIDKVRDEVAYFFNPLELINLTKGGLFPSIALIDNYVKLFKNFGKEMYAIGIDDEKAQDKNYVIKYFLKGLPITSQFDTIFLLFFPDMAKDLGIKSQSQSRPVGL